LLKLGDTQTIILQSSDTFEESKKVVDPAFTQLPPDVAFPREAHGSVFLNIEKNRAKMESAAPAEGKHADAILGLVAEFSYQPFFEGKEFISPMRGVLHTEPAGSAVTTLRGVKAPADRVGSRCPNQPANSGMMKIFIAS
jgi:hypothetical protein